MNQIEVFKQRFADLVWKSEPADQPFPRRLLIRGLRLAWLLARDLSDGYLNMQAMGLVYTTLLSLVPLLALSFSVLKAFEVHNQIEPLLLNLLAPLGEKGVEITTNIIGFVDNIRVGVLGVVGLGLLLYTVISLIQKVERAFNYTWHVSRPRPFMQRFSDYLSVLLIGPVLVVSALGATTAIMSSAIIQRFAQFPLLAWLVETVGTLLPYFFVIAAFAFVYLFVPNTRVRVSSALVGALLAGILWQTVGWGFASFVVTSTKYTAIYSGFAILVLFMVWLYLAWLILLVGASIAFYHQHPEHLNSRRRDLEISIELKERLGLLIMYLVARTHFAGEAPWSTARLAAHLGVPQQAVGEVLGLLCGRSLLLADAADPPGYLPARAPETLPMTELLDALRSSGEDMYAGRIRSPELASVQALEKQLLQARAGALQHLSLRDFVMGHGHAYMDGPTG